MSRLDVALPRGTSKQGHTRSQKSKVVDSEKVRGSLTVS